MTGPFMVRKHDEGGGVVRLAVHGEVDSDTSAALSLIIVNAAEQPGAEVLLIDLGGVTFLAAAGVRSLLEGGAAALRGECSYHVVNAQGVVAQTLTAVGVTTPVIALPAHPASQPCLSCTPY